MGRLPTVIVDRVIGRVVAVLAAAVMSSAGCAQLAGIDDTNSDGRAGNSVTLTRLSIGKTVGYSPLELTGLRASYLVANPASASGFDRVPAVEAGDGTWTSTLREAAPVEFTLPDVPTPIPRMFAFPGRALTILHAVLEHTAPSPAPDGSMLSVTVDLDTPYVTGHGFQVFTVGSWTRRAFAAAEIPQAPDTGVMQIGLSYVFNSSASLSGRPQLDRLTTDDAFLILRYSGAALTGVAEPMPFEQIGDHAVMATGPHAMKPVTPDRMLDVRLEANLVGRYAPVRPAVSGLSIDWSLVAAPGYFIASNAGPVLQSGSLTPADVGVVVAYGNPFVDREWRTIFTLATTASRVFTPPGTTAPVTLFAAMTEFIEPSTSDRITLAAGLPELISIDGKPLSIDGQMIAQPNKLVEVTFVSGDPTNTLYSVAVFDLLPNVAGTALDYHLVFAAASNEARFQIPPEVFQPGHSYTLRAGTTLGGFPAIGEGDFMKRELPMSQALLDSGVFTVTP